MWKEGWLLKSCILWSGLHMMIHQSFSMAWTTPPLIEPQPIPPKDLLDFTTRRLLSDKNESRKTQPTTSEGGGFLVKDCQLPTKGSMDPLRLVCVYSNSQISVISTPEIFLDGSLERLSSSHPNRPSTEEEYEPERRESHNYKLVNIKGKGTRAIATQAIEFGKMIRGPVQPVIITCREEWMVEYDNEDLMKSAYEALGEEAQEMIDDLPHSRQALYPKVIMSSLTTELGGLSHWILASEMTHFNHDCSPNAVYYFDKTYLEFNLHAIIPISQGDEITISYRDVIATRGNRRLNPPRDGFECQCAKCTAKETKLQSQHNLKEIHQHYRLIKDWKNPVSQVLPRDADRMIDLYKVERLHHQIWEAYFLASQVYNSYGLITQSVAYANEALKLAMLSKGIGDEQWEGFSQTVILINQPEWHWTFNYKI